MPVALVQGSDWSTVHVRSTTAPFKGVDDESKQVDKVKYVKFSGISWWVAHQLRRSG
jgi:hypothetical protein